MNLVKTLTLLLTSAVFLTCSTNELNQAVKISVDTSFILAPDFTYNYGSSTGIHTSSQISNQLVDVSNETVFIFDATDGNLIEKIDLPTEGKFKFDKLSGFDGAIPVEEGIIYLNHFENSISIIEKSGKISTLQKIDKFREGIISASYANTPVLHDSCVIVSIFPNPTSPLNQKYSLGIYDIKHDSIRYSATYPQPYADNFYGAISYLYWNSVAWCEWRKSFISSFPIDNKIYEYDQNFNLIGDFQASSTKFKAVTPFSEPVSEGDYPDWEKDNQYYRNLSHYDGLYVDNVDHLVYRIVRHHKAEINFQHEYEYSVVSSLSKLTLQLKLKLLRVNQAIKLYNWQVSFVELLSTGQRAIFPHRMGHSRRPISFQHIYFRRRLIPSGRNQVYRRQTNFYSI